MSGFDYSWVINDARCFLSTLFMEGGKEKDICEKDHLLSQFDIILEQKDRLTSEKETDVAMMDFFYVFCPLGSKRWLIVKTLLRIFMHPRLYVKIINKKNIGQYFNILFKANLINYNQQIERQYIVVAPPFSPPPPPPPPPPVQNIILSTDNKLVIPDCSNPTVLFYYVIPGSEKQLNDSVSSVIRNATVPYKIVVAGNSKHPGFDSIQNIEIIPIHEIHLYLSKYPTIKYISLIDGSTVVQYDTVSACLGTLEGNDTFSMVVPMVLDKEGLIDSAGSILWNDGSFCQVGKGQDPYNPEFLFLRETDTSDHFAMVKKEMFCQWTSQEPMVLNSWPYPLHDLSMFIRKSQAKVIFQPQAHVWIDQWTNIEILPEYVSLFKKKWENQLLEDHVPDGTENYFYARERGRGKKYMLMIDHYVPTFDKDAGSRSMKAYMELFIDHNIILKFIGDNFYPEEKYVTYFQQKGIEILYGRHCEKNWLPWLKKYGKVFDFVFISRPTIAIKYIDAIKEFTRAKILFYGHDLHYLREYRQYQLEQKEELLQYSQKSRQMESGLFETVDVIYYPSQAEIDIIQTEFKIKGKARKIALYIFDVFEKPDYYFNERKDIMFVGGFLHQPNSDAITWFLDEVFPNVCKSVSGIKLFIAGSNPTEAIKSRTSENIVVTGFLSEEELKQLYKKCRLVIAPLRYGAGLKGKIVEALYYGLPVVTTSIGFEGLDGAESIISVADTAEDFAQAVIRLYTDERELTYRSMGSFEFVKANFSKEKAYSIIQPDLDQDIRNLTVK